MHYTNWKKIAGISLSVATIITACTSNQQEISQPGSPDKIPNKSIAIKTAPVQFIKPQYELSLPAELKPYEQVAVYAKVTGFVKQLYADRGTKVTKGQLLALLEAPEMNQRYLSDRSTEQKAQSDYQYAKQAYDRLLDAAKTTGAVAAIELDRAKSAMESARSAYESYRASTAQTSQLQDYLRITAPFDGIITDRKISVGALSGAGSSQPLFVMAEGKRLRLTVSLPEKHAASIHAGMAATFSISSQPGKIFTTTLSRTSGLINQQDRSLILEFDVDNSSGEIKGGDYAQVTLQLQRQFPSYWVSGKSILNTQAGMFVLTLNEGIVKRIPVKEGVSKDTLTEVFGDLSPDDRIIVKPSEEMKEGRMK